MSDQEGRELPAVAWRYRYIRPSGTKGVWRVVYEEGECNLTEDYEREPLTPLHPAQEALDRAEAQEIRLNDALAESETALREAEHRLERVRGVVGAAVRETAPLERHAEYSEAPDSLCAIYLTTYDLLPEDRMWAEGES